MVASPTEATPKNSGVQAPDRAKNIVRGIGSLTIQNLGTSLIGFVFLAGLAHILSPVQFGIYTGVLVSVAISQAFSTFGLSLSATKYIAFLRESDEKTSWAAARRIFLLSLLLTVVVTAIYLALSPVLSSYFTKSQDWLWAFLLGAAWVFTSSISNTMQGILQGLKKYSQLAKIVLVSRFAMVVLSFGLLFAFPNVGFAIAAWALFNGMVVIWIFAVVGRNLLTASGRFEYSTILRYSAPLGIAAIIAVFSAQSDTVVVGGYLSTQSLGVYGAAITLSGVLGVVALAPLTTAFFPEISSARSDGEITYGVKLSMRYVTLAILPASLFVAAVPDQLLDLFSSGGAYLAGALTLEVVALFYIFFAIQSILIVLLQAIGRTIEVIVVGIVGAASDIGIALLLVPHLGLAGAVASKVAVSISGLIVTAYFSRQYIKNLDKLSFYAKGALAAVIPFALVLALSYYFSSRLITLAPYALVYAAVFLACSKWLKLLSDEDRAFLSQLLPGGLRKIAARL